PRAAGKHAARTRRGAAHHPFPRFSFHPFSSHERKRKRKASAMTSQIPDQMPLPGPLNEAVLPAADGARRCKQPGCGTELPAATGRGAPRLFCSPACSRKWHNDSRLAPGAAGQQQAAAAAGPLAGLRQLLTQAAELASAAAAELAAADPGRVAATLDAADTARADADADAARAQALRDQADAQITEIRRDAGTALAAARDEAGAAHAARDAALAAAAQDRHHADTEISRARQGEADARAENEHVRADAARERDAQAAACTAQLHALQALADTWRARAEHAEQQLDLERDHQRRLAAQPAAGDPGGGASPGAAVAPAATRQAAARATTRAGSSRP